MGCIAVFAKPPVPGRVKTRLGRAVGHAAAAELARALLIDTVARWQRTGHDVVLATPEPGVDHGVELPWVDQGRDGLGARIERVLRAGLQRGGWALAVGADAPAIPQDALDQSIALLEAGRDVLGPADDGGFWALGLHACPQGLLDGIPWSDPTTGDRTRERLQSQGYDPALLPGAWDVDHASDLPRLVAAAALAPCSASVARRILGDR